MKCRPGDLAFLICHPIGTCALEDAVVRAVRDRIVRVTCVQPNGLWKFEHPLHVELVIFGRPFFGRVVAAADECLRPIRGEAPDEETETPADVIRSIAWACS